MATEGARAAERPFLQRPQGILAVAGGAVALVASVLGLVFLLLPGLQPEPPAPELEIVDFDLDREENVRADWITPDGVEEREDYPASQVTLVLRNPSDNPILITRADFRFDHVREAGCAYGAGPTEVQARYDIKVPDGKDVPFTLERKMKYTVPPHAQERIAFTLGPERDYAGSLPKIYAFTVTLHADDGTERDIPLMHHIAPVSRMETALSAAQQAMAGQYSLTSPECVREQAREVSEIVDSATYASSELKRFRDELAAVTQ
ncbi:hypothetical protein JJV70_21450 [Streptomyces sp. JJ66]|uniref:hypothetical protein n=1 Tax=Streptomyces sp. JJ66 TaxID=2803843 RepID=UPI001C5611AB|nr:hypothetical protein [Streptomyces sp. JJ66]MBW1604618.1 hypothetical protein [Streptomyces sp. JJ66]